MHWFKTKLPETTPLFIYISTALKRFIQETQIRYIATQLLFPILGKDGITPEYLEELVSEHLMPISQINESIGLLKNYNIISEGGIGRDGKQYLYFINWSFFEEFLDNVKRDEKGIIVI